MDEAREETVEAGRATHARFVVLALITGATAINYLDRAVLSVAAPFLTADLALDATQMGLVFSAFSWTYAAAQVPGGIFLDRFGARFTYFISMTIWSFFTLVQGLATSITHLIVFRLGLGIAEAPCFPTNSRVLSIWFPQQERARANSVYAVGQYFGLAFMSPALFWIAVTFGWRTLLIVVGLVGIVFGAIWWFNYRDPLSAKNVNRAELEHIEAGGGLAYTDQPQPFSWATMAKLMRRRQILGASIGQFAGNSTLVFFLTWFPTYLVKERGLDFLSAGTFAVMPFVAASAGVIVGGVLSDILLKRTGSASIARKLPIVAGLALVSCIVAANYIDSNAIVIAALSIAFFGQGMVNLGWTLITDVAPKNLLGLTGGIFNLCANIAGILTPLVIGLILNATGSFFYGLSYIAVIALIGIFSYVFVVGKVERVEINETVVKA